MELTISVETMPKTLSVIKTQSVLQGVPTQERGNNMKNYFCLEINEPQGW